MGNNKFGLGMTLPLAAIALMMLASAPRSNAGTEMITDNSAQTMPPPRPVYRYAPPRPVVYLAPPPVRLIAYPRVGCYGPSYGRAYAYDRFGGHRRGYHRPYHHWR